MSVPRPCFLLVDDHALFRTGLGLMLSQHWPGARTVQAASWGETLLALTRESPDLILLDVHLPDGHGLQDLPVLQARVPQCPVLLMSAEVDATQVERAREAGAAGFLPKSASITEVMAAVRQALRGLPGSGMPPALHGSAAPSTPRVASWAQADPAPARWAVKEAGPDLSRRQREILAYLGRGTPNKAIARQMAMTESDVRAEVSWLTEWLGASSREQAYAEALARGLLTPS